MLGEKAHTVHTEELAKRNLLPVFCHQLSFYCQKQMLAASHVEAMGAWIPRTEPSGSNCFSCQGHGS